MRRNRKTKEEIRRDRVKWGETRRQEDTEIGDRRGETGRYLERWEKIV